MTIILLGEKMIEEIKELSNIVTQNTSSESMDKIRFDIKNSETELDEIKKLASDTEDILRRCIKSWDNFTTVLNALKSWENVISDKVCFLLII